MHHGDATQKEKVCAVLVKRGNCEQTSTVLLSAASPPFSHSLMASSLMPKPLDARHLPCGAELPPVDLAGALADGQRDGLRRLDPSGAQLARVDLVHRGVRRADDRAQRAPGQG